MSRGREQVEEHIEPPRSIGLAGTALFPLNGMIGAGIFVLPALLFAAVGNFAPWLILLGGIAFFPLIFVFSALSRRFDHSGGPVLYGEAAFGPFIGFQAGWMRYASGFTAIAANAHVMVSYAAAFWPVLRDPVAGPLAVTASLAFLTLINLFGTSKATGTLGGMTVVKLLPLVALVIAGLLAGSPAIGFSLPQFSDIQKVVLLTFYAFMGFETANVPAGEMKNPRRNLPRALIGMLAGVTLVYMLVTWAYIAIDPANPDKAMPLAAAAREMMGRMGTIVIILAATFSIGGNLLNNIITTPRLTYGMAEDGMLPPWFMHVSRRFRTPDFSILFFGGCGILSALTGGFVILATVGTLSRLVTYLICAAALPVIQRKEQRAGKGPAEPFEAAMAALAFVFCLWVSSSADNRAFLTLLVLLAVGTLLFLLGRRGARLEPSST